MKELRKILGFKTGARDKSSKLEAKHGYPSFSQEISQLQERADGYPYITTLVAEIDRSIQTMIHDSVVVQETFVTMSLGLLDGIVRRTCRRYGIVVQDEIKGQVLVIRTFIPPARRFQH